MRAQDFIEGEQFLKTPSSLSDLDRVKRERVNKINLLNTVQDTIMRIDTVPEPPAPKPPFIHVYPNPVVENLTLQVDTAYFPYTFAIHDFSGRLVFIKENISEFEYYPDLRHLPKAMFIARIISREEIEWKGKLLKQ